MASKLLSEIFERKNKMQLYFSKIYIKNKIT